LPWVEKVKVMPLTGKVEFTDTYDPEASVCIPAAYTGPDGMGRWGYGWVGNKILCPWTIFYRHWQTYKRTQRTAYPF